MFKRKKQPIFLVKLIYFAYLVFVLRILKISDFFGPLRPIVLMTKFLATSLIPVDTVFHNLKTGRLQPNEISYKCPIGPETKGTLIYI